MTLPQFLETKEYFPVPGDIFTIKIITSRGEKIDFELIVQNGYTLQIPYLGSYNSIRAGEHLTPALKLSAASETASSASGAFTPWSGDIYS